MVKRRSIAIVSLCHWLLAASACASSHIVQGPPYTLAHIEKALSWPAGTPFAQPGYSAKSITVAGEGVLMKWSRTASRMSPGELLDHSVSTRARRLAGHIPPDRSNNWMKLVCRLTVRDRHSRSN